MEINLPDIHHSFKGYQDIARMHKDIRDLFMKEIEIDMAGTRWIDADMCAALGAVFSSILYNLNTLRIRNINNNIKNILSRNGFLSHFGGEKIPDSWGTTIPYRKLGVDDGKLFAEYVKFNLVDREEIPAMSKQVKKRFLESVCEIFNNSVVHSRTELGIFSCGQYFPKKHRLVFSIADLGIGIKRKVEEHFGTSFTAEDAIEWALVEGNTTKRDSIPGGLGLKLIKEFVELNIGRLTIVSDAGYWNMANGRVSKRTIVFPFPGTVVSIEIDTEDRKSYMLSSEMDNDDIF